MFGKIKAFAKKHLKVLSVVGTAVTAAMSMAVACSAEDTSSVDTTGITSAISSAGTNLQAQFAALVSSLVPMVIAIAVTGLGLYAIISLFNLAKKIFKTAAR